MPKFVNQEAAEKWARITYQCSLNEALRVNGAPLSDSKSFAGRYRHQKHGAAKRGIDWEFSFPEWVAVWVASGKWEQRGVGKSSYCMARYGDAGPYSVANVSIQTCEANSRDGIEKARPAMRARGYSGTQVGSGRGWTYRPERSRLKPYQVVICSTYIGCFATQQEAERAYLSAAENVVHKRRLAEVYR